jgi:tyrosyl-tRNA synthetase
MPAVSSDQNAIQHFLTRGVENVYPSRAFVEKALASGKRLTIYSGIDPTGPTLHLGHVIWLKKLAELQAMGHKVIMLIGDFTAMIGDPTDKGATRKMLTRKEVLANSKSYKKQASRFLKFSGANAAEIKFNSKWLGKMSFVDVVDLASNFTVQQLEERDMFQKRLEEGKPIHLHEFLYPVMQAQDSVAMDVDMEIGGNDQTFNMLAGRDLMKSVKNKEKSVLTTKLLVDTTGKKMGKSEGNMVALTDSPEDMYGKVMSWTDGMIVGGFELVTEATDSEIKDIQSRIAAGENPMPFKRKLAREIVAVLSGEKEATAADANFTRVHQKHEAPEEMQTLNVSSGMTLVDALVASGVVASKSDARRQIEQGGVKVDGAAIMDASATVSAGSVVQKGKRHFVKLI